MNNNKDTGTSSHKARPRNGRNSPSEEHVRRWFNILRRWPNIEPAPMRCYKDRSGLPGYRSLQISSDRVRTKTFILTVDTVMMTVCTHCYVTLCHGKAEKAECGSASLWSAGNVSITSAMTVMNNYYGPIL